MGVGVGLTYRAHKINHPAAGLITRVPSALIPPSSGGVLGPVLASRSPHCPSTTGGRIWGAKAEFLSHFLSLPGGPPRPRGPSSNPMSSFSPLSPSLAQQPCLSTYFLLVPLAPLPSNSPKQSWGVRGSRRSAVDLLALGLMGLLSSQPPLNDPSGSGDDGERASWVDIESKFAS